MMKTEILAKGKLAVMFEEEYRNLARSPDYQILFKEIDLDTYPAQVHNGYFSIDKKGPLCRNR